MHSAAPSKEVLLQALQSVVDPELGCSIVDLGLIYNVTISDCRKVSVEMTLTTPGCPMQETMANGVQNALRKLNGVEEVDVQIVWDPPWDPSMMNVR